MPGISRRGLIHSRQNACFAGSRMTPSTTRRTWWSIAAGCVCGSQSLSYISGHMMVVPYLHTGEFDSTPKEITDEMMDLTKRAGGVA